MRIDIERSVLDPCPYCGGIGDFRLVGDRKQYYVVFCSKCGNTPVLLDCANLYKFTAAREWNKRCRNDSVD